MLYTELTVVLLILWTKGKMQNGLNKLIFINKSNSIIHDNKSSVLFSGSVLFCYHRIRSVYEIRSVSLGAPYV